eukprot:CAMPEP_0179236824 /NCGR_PEP_ID=MMETSP0797-20121207/14126_1 /TAXON_ID=47934 /ORGANISM="Dinophysis acuminata, Strain DAEP01" /LENGTH=515 /DNA_ID=CAMNT_0020944091 /DNA_START=293 /DNA_END=1840 /DNA_ORIENTATION=-
MATLVWLGMHGKRLRSRIGAALGEAEGNDASMAMAISTKVDASKCEELLDELDYSIFTKDLLHITSITSAERCRGACEGVPRCGAWTWGKARGIQGLTDVCFLKEVEHGQTPAKAHKTGVMSGLRPGSDCQGPTSDMVFSKDVDSGMIKTRDGLCLDAPHPTVSGGKVILWRCNRTNSKQQWVYDYSTGMIKNAYGLCLDVQDRTKLGSVLQVWDCVSGNFNQKWSFGASIGRIKLRHGMCLDAAEPDEGVQPHMWRCSAGEANQHWSFGHAGPNTSYWTDSPGSLFCFALMMPGSYEQNLLAMQYKRRWSMFDCAEYVVYSNRSIEILDGLRTVVVDSDLMCSKGGEFMTALNLEIFIAVWKRVIKDRRFQYHTWTVKVDPDAVFFASRLRDLLRAHPEPPGGVYLNNCRMGMHGPLEVFSRQAVEAWSVGMQPCLEHFHKLCKGDCLWGEDMFIDQCLWKVLKVRRDNDYSLLLEDHCDPPEGWDDCQDDARVAFHPFKKEKDYIQCVNLAQA